MLCPYWVHWLYVHDVSEGCVPVLCSEGCVAMLVSERCSVCVGFEIDVHVQCWF